MKTVFGEPTRLPGLAGSYALITGATRGMGLRTAELLAENGVNVAVNSRSAKAVRETAARLQDAYEVSTLACAGDVADLAEVKSIFAALREWSNDRLDLLVCNAGYPLEDELWHTPLHAYSDVQITRGFDKVHRVDVQGARLCSREALALMLPQRRGALIYISSTPAISGFKGTPYTEAKAAVLGLMRDLAVEYAEHGIRANALALGDIESGWYYNLSDEEKQRLASEAPMGRWGRPEEVAGAIAFLASDLAGFINGQTIVVDGGKIIR